MSSTDSVVSSAFAIGQKGRLMLPAAVRRAAHLDEGTEVVARTDGEGRVVIESVDAIRARLWAAAPEPSGLDVESDLAAMRADDRLVAQGNAHRQHVELGSEQESEQAGAALLAHLGL